jgi:hypothetical protein
LFFSLLFLKAEIGFEVAQGLFAFGFQFGLSFVYGKIEGCNEGAVSPGFALGVLEHKFALSGKDVDDQCHGSSKKQDPVDGFGIFAYGINHKALVCVCDCKGIN